MHQSQIQSTEPMHSPGVDNSSLPLTWKQRVVQHLSPLQRFFWVPSGCFPDAKAMAQALSPKATTINFKFKSNLVPAAASAAQDPRAGAELFVAEMMQGKLVGDCLLVATAEDHVLPGVQGLHGVDTPAEHWVLRRCRYRRQVTLPGTAVILAAASGANYYHWLLESLPRLVLLREAGYSLDQIDHFLLNEQQQPFHEQTLDLLGIPAAKRRPGCKARVYCCDRLVVPSLPAPPVVFPAWVLDFLRRSFLPTARRAAHGQRLFISRRRAARRRVDNEQELGALLRRAGFKTVSLETCSFAEQVELFASASVVVAPHGAGLANLVFANPGTKVIELVGPSFINHCYKKLCLAASLSHCEVVGTLQNKPRKRCEEDDYAIAPNQLCRALVAMGLAPATA